MFGAFALEAKLVNQSKIALYSRTSTAEASFLETVELPRTCRSLDARNPVEITEQETRPQQLSLIHI